MNDYLGYRALFGVPTPSTNTVVQPEFDAMRPAGVTNHIGRMHITDMPIATDSDFERLIQHIDLGLEDAVERVMTCNPHHIVLGVSALAIWGGDLAWSENLKARILRRAGRSIGVTLASDAIPAALKAHGVKRKIAIMEPYFPVVEPRLRSFFYELGYEVVRFRHLQGSSPTRFTQLSTEAMIDALRSIDGDDVEALVQFGANLPMARLAGEAERWLRKPVVAVNVATYWHALRQCGIDDKIHGFTRLLAEH